MMLDITKLLCTIKECISNVESGNISKKILDEIEINFLEFIELAKLFLISERDSYYGYFFMNMQIRIDFTINSIAGIKLNEFPTVFETNPLLLCKFSLKEILYIICHEIDHIVLNHPVEMIKANPDKNPDIFYKFNLAADASVNDRINYEIERENRKFLSSPDGIITSAILAKIFNLNNVIPMENYAYYFRLIIEKEKNNKSIVIPIKQDGLDKENLTQDEEISNSLQKKWWQYNEVMEDNLDGINNTVITSKNCKKILDHNWQSGDDIEDAMAIIRELINSTVDMMNEETRGMISKDFFKQIEIFNAPAQLPWQAILKKYIGTITANKIKTRRRLNRRQPDRFDLSGNVDDKFLKIIVAIDTSSSINDKMISQIFNEIFAILAKRKYEITVIECDAKVQRVYRVKNIFDLQTKVKGRGGTYFSPVIEYINNDRYFRDALLIYFTDGYGENKIPKPLTYRNIWVVFDNVSNLTIKEPYGIVLKF